METKNDNFYLWKSNKQEMKKSGKQMIQRAIKRLKQPRQQPSTMKKLYRKPKDSTENVGVNGRDVAKKN